MFKYIISVVLLTMSFTVRGQDTLKALGKSPDLFLLHTVQKGDNYYSLGRKYHLPPQEIALGNHLNFHEPLKTFQLLHIPLTADNFSQGKDSRGQPVYRKVQKGETLYRVGLNSNKTPLENIRSWNHLSGNNVSAGQYLVIGWLKGGADAHPAMASAPAEKQADTPSAPVTAASTAVNTAGAAPSGSGAGVSPDNGGSSLLNEVIADERAKRQNKNGISGIKKADQEEKKQPVAATPQEQDTPQQIAAAPVEEKKDTDARPNAFAAMLSKIDAKSSNMPPAAKQPARQQNPAPDITGSARAAATAAPAPATVPAPVTAATSGSATPSAAAPAGNMDTNSMAVIAPVTESPFASSYAQQTGNTKQVTTEKGAGAWFKSNMTADTQKFYALHNTAPRGTIIKVTNPLNGKFVYVKVLDRIPQVGGNANLIIKIADAAMQELGITSARFFCELQYGKN